jgi:NAD(P)-dependent dehydrogenase (short-subunit alcohol dehydrogenase family)
MGRATARRLTAEGMQVCVADVNGDTAKGVAGEIGGLAVTVDVSDFEALDAARNACADRFGRLDLAYLNAGIAGVGNLPLSCKPLPRQCKPAAPAGSSSTAGRLRVP